MSSPRSSGYSPAFAASNERGRSGRQIVAVRRSQAQEAEEKIVAAKKMALFKRDAILAVQTGDIKRLEVLFFNQSRITSYREFYNEYVTRNLKELTMDCCFADLVSSYVGMLHSLLLDKDVPGSQDAASLNHIAEAISSIKESVLKLLDDRLETELSNFYVADVRHGKILKINKDGRGGIICDKEAREIIDAMKESIKERLLETMEDIMPRGKSIGVKYEKERLKRMRIDYEQRHQEILRSQNDAKKQFLEIIQNKIASVTTEKLTYKLSLDPSYGVEMGDLPIDINFRDSGGNSLLYYAFRTILPHAYPLRLTIDQALMVVSLLVDYGVNLSSANEFNRTPMYMVVEMLKESMVVREALSKLFEAVNTSSKTFEQCIEDREETSERSQKGMLLCDPIVAELQNKIEQVERNAYQGTIDMLERLLMPRAAESEDMIEQDILYL